MSLSVVGIEPEESHEGLACLVEVASGREVAPKVMIGARVRGSFVRHIAPHHNGIVIVGISVNSKSAEYEDGKECRWAKQALRFVDQSRDQRARAEHGEG